MRPEDWRGVRAHLALRLHWSPDVIAAQTWSTLNEWFDDVLRVTHDLTGTA